MLDLTSPLLNLTHYLSTGKKNRKNRKAHGKQRNERISVVSFENKPKVRPDSGTERSVSYMWWLAMSDFCLVKDDQCISHFESMCKVIWYSVLSDFEQRLVLYSMQNPGELVILGVVNRENPQQMCCKVLCCNTFRDLNCTSVSFIYPVYCKLFR